MFIKLAKHRKFEYTPRYYKPEGEDRIRQRIRIRRQRQRAKGRSLVWMIAMLAFVLYVMYLLSQIGK